jgi:hypothetical protein
MNPRAATVLLLCLGLAHMAGDMLGIPWLKGLAAATGASPAPKVFSAVRGLETYSTRFVIEWRDAAGVTHEHALDSETYARLRGPYNRRNVYGAALAYGPVLAAEERSRALLEAVLRRGLCGERPLLAELGIPVDAVVGAPRLRYEVREGSELDGLVTAIEAPCP